ncbi:MAG: Major facilitator superfamily protein 10 Tetracycline transporter-like protein [Candidatus Peribacteria bacterium]|nr:Major facilitator superfamily protein 10 Tetracycline transporter-like protein [Candidatus Peribacteria bacterium]
MTDISRNVSTHKRTLVPLFLTVFLDMMGVGIALPVLAVIVLDTPVSILPAHTSLATRSILYGFLLAAYPLLQFFGSPILGAASDRYGRKVTLIMSLFGTLVGYALFAIGIVTRNVPLLFFSRALDGFTGGNISIAMSAAADISQEKSLKTRNFGLLGMAFGLGFILGPYIGGKLSDSTLHPALSIATPFWFAAALSVINILLFLVFFQETLHTRSKARISLFTGFYNIKRAMEISHLRTILLVVFILTLGFNFFVQFFQVFLIEKFHYNQSNIGDFFGYAGVWIAIVQGFLVRPITKRFGLRRTIAVCSFLLALLLPALLLPNTSIYLYLLIPFIAIAEGLLDPAASTIVSDLAGEEMQGEIIGIKQSLQALAAAIPPIIGGFISTIHPNLPIFVASTVTFIAWLLFVFYFHEQPGPNVHAQFPLFDEAGKKQ